MFGFLKPKPRVLLLDDDVSMQKLMAAILRRAGYKVDVVNSGKKAIAALAERNYHAILLDLMMPHEGGMTVIGHIRETRPELLKRVVVVSATPPAVLKGIAAEVFGIVRKPFVAGDLVSTVNGLR